MSGRCPRADEVDAALDGRLSDAAARDAFAHAARCPDCDALRRERPRVRELLNALPDGAPDELSARRLRARLVSSALRRGAPPRSRWALAAVAVAAALALVVGLRAARAPANVPLEPGEWRLGVAGALRPSPGAVWSLRDERGDTRVLLDDGAVTLRVRKRRAGERFRVVLRDAEVEVRGTRFEVTAQGGRLRAVRVEEGLVAVRRRGDAELLLAAGSRFVAPEEVAPPEPRRDPPTAPPTVVADVAPRRPASPAPDPGREFRAGALAHVRGDHATAAAALGRFLTSSMPGDSRREDARYVRVLALRGAGREEEAAAEAWRYLREFPTGLRCAETASWLARSRAARGDCEGAARAAMGVPEGASDATRAAVARALANCGR
jgi:ferric-dicitrate binding protein FerR (iron transport regulator)